MSLPTPPRSSHRGKENRFSSGSRVVWSQHNQYHVIANTPHVPAAASASKELPTKSILKKTSHILLPLLDNDQREITPEPSDPLVDLKYLEYPVSKIVSPDSSLLDLIEGYSVLAARLRPCVSKLTDPDTSWPLFQPLRKHRNAIIDAFIRDLGRALKDPADGGPKEIEEKGLLPSPKQSPRKKKGMTAECVKYARDLCTTCHSVMKLLGMVFALPAFYQIFTDEQLRAVLTQVLAIPLANELPTPNARKTCALAIWLIQVQRLPSEVLLPSRDRIAYALRRGVDGELGKDGKKGSASDGLKAIHDLSLYQPSTFVPAFTAFLPSILANLLAPNLTRRSQACHALGGFALASTSLPPSYIHTRISSLVTSFLVTNLRTPEELPPKSPSKASSGRSGEEGPIVRTLRTTLGANDPQHVAQGPIWALCVIAHFIVLLGNALCTDITVCRIISSLLALSARHKKMGVKGVALLVWRVATWAYFQPPLLADPDEESEVEEAEVATPGKALTVRDEFWKTVASWVEMGSGIATITALMSNDVHNEDDLRRTIGLLQTMTSKGGDGCHHAMIVMEHLVSFKNPDTDWDINRLLPSDLFSASPGLLTTEFKALFGIVKSIVGQFSEVADVRSLTREDVAKDWVLEALANIWKEALSFIELPDEAQIPDEIMAVWTGLLTCLTISADTNGTERTSYYAVRAADILTEVLRDPNLNFIPRVDSSSTSDASASVRTNEALRLKVVRDLWSKARTVIPHEQLGDAGEKLIGFLMETEHEITDSDKGARIEWTSLCAEVLVVCDSDNLRAFWGYKVSRSIKQWERSWASDVRRLVWRRFVEQWMEDGTGNWEGGVVMLGVPFAEPNTWDMINDDFVTWEDLLCHSMNRALDYGVDSIAVLDHVAELVSQNQSPTVISSTRIADLLLSHLDMPDALQIPEAVIEFVNDVLRSSYPPQPHDKIRSLWMIRSLTHVIDKCPTDLIMSLLDIVEDGLCTWISDEYQALSLEEYLFDILALYQTTLLTIQALPRTVETLERVGAILESAFCGRKDKPASVSEAFTEFWQSTYASMPVPDNGWPPRIQSLPTGDAVEKTAFSETGYDADTSLDGVADADDSFELTSGQLQVMCPRDVSVHERMEHCPMNEEQELDFAAAPGPGVTIWPKLPSTPVRSSVSFSRTSTPLRPHKPSSGSEFFPLQSPSSPIATSQRTPVSPKHTPTAKRNTGSCSPNKRRKIEDKENESPQFMSTAAECVATKSPVGTTPLVSRKRRRQSDELGEGKLAKKGKLVSYMPFDQLTNASSGESEDERSVEKSLIPAAMSTICTSPGAATYQESSPRPSPKKRKGVFMDAVEVPSLQEVYGRLKKTASLNPSSLTFGTPLSHRVRRQTRSVMRSPGHAITIEECWNDVSRKRQRNSDCFKVTAISDLFLSSLLQPVPGNVVRDGHSVTSAPSSEESSRLSSDDDPHLGQVTPHHLISPPLRRVYPIDDPPSDDSDLPSSPSQGVVSRRLQRSARLSP